MTPKLRRKAPFFCRAQVNGKLCNAVLAEDDGKLCKPCTKAAASAQAKFNQPIARTDTWELPIVPRRIWP